MDDDARRATVERLLDAVGNQEARRIAGTLAPRTLRLVDRVIAARCAVRLLSQGAPRPVILARLEAGHVGSRRSAQRLLAAVVAPRQNGAPNGARGGDDAASSTSQETLP